METAYTKPDGLSLMEQQLIAMFRATNDRGREWVNKAAYQCDVGVES